MLPASQPNAFAQLPSGLIWFSMLQVWWYHAGLFFGRLAVHNVATSETKPITVSQQMPAVLVMAQVWPPSCPPTCCHPLAFTAVCVAFHRGCQRSLGILLEVLARE